MAEHLRGAARLATSTWRGCAERLLTRNPKWLEVLKKPEVTEGSFTPGTNVEVHWQRTPWEEGSWLPAKVSSVHSDGRYVVRFKCGGERGDSERHVASERLRCPQS